jgi:hypothetical protein
MAAAQQKQHVQLLLHASSNRIAFISGQSNKVKKQVSHTRS